MIIEYDKLPVDARYISLNSSKVRLTPFLQGLPAYRADFFGALSWSMRTYNRALLNVSDGAVLRFVEDEAGATGDQGETYRGLPFQRLA